MAIFCSSFRVYAFSVFPPRFAVGKNKRRSAVWTLNEECNFSYFETASDKISEFPVMANSLEQQTDVYEFGDFRVDAAKRLLLNGDGETVPLTPKVFDTLLYLVEHAGKIIEKDELMREIWADTIVEENNLSVQISALRKALGESNGASRVGFLPCSPDHEDAPSLRVVEIVHFERHHCIAQGRIELCSFFGKEPDGVVVAPVKHGQDHR